MKRVFVVKGPNKVEFGAPMDGCEGEDFMLAGTLTDSTWTQNEAAEVWRNFAPFSANRIASYLHRPIK